MWCIFSIELLDFACSINSCKVTVYQHSLLNLTIFAKFKTHVHAYLCHRCALLQAQVRSCRSCQTSHSVTKSQHFIWPLCCQVLSQVSVHAPAGLAWRTCNDYCTRSVRQQVSTLAKTIR